MIRGMKVRDRETGRVGFVSSYSNYGTYHKCGVRFLDGSLEDYTYNSQALELYNSGLYELEASLQEEEQRKMEQKKDQASRQQHADKYL